METEPTIDATIKRINRQAFRVFVAVQFGGLARISRQEACRLIRRHKDTPNLIDVSFDTSMGDGRDIVYLRAKRQ